MMLRYQGARAFVEAKFAKNRLEINVRGPVFRTIVGLVEKIVEEVEHSQEHYPGVTFRQMVRSPHHPEGFVGIPTCLQVLLKPKDQQTIYCPETKKPIDCEQLLVSSGIIEPANPNAKFFWTRNPTSDWDKMDRFSVYDIVSDSGFYRRIPRTTRVPRQTLSMESLNLIKDLEIPKSPVVIKAPIAPKDESAQLDEAENSELPKNENMDAAKVEQEAENQETDVATTTGSPEYLEAPKVESEPAPNGDNTAEIPSPPQNLENSVGNHSEIPAKMTSLEEETGKLSDILKILQLDFSSVQRACAVFNRENYDSFETYRRMIVAKQKAGLKLLQKDWKELEDVRERNIIYKHFEDYTKKFDWNGMEKLYPFAIEIDEASITDFFHFGIRQFEKSTKGFGRGWYFTNNITAHQERIENVKHYLICFINVGMVYPATENPGEEGALTNCKNGYQSHYTLVDQTGNINLKDVNSPKTEGVIVVFEDRQILPAFLISLS